MPKELVVKLSRFFKEKIDLENLASSDLKIKKEKIEIRPQSPEFEFKGFPIDEILYAEIKLDTSKNKDVFLGFTSTERETSKKIADDRFVRSLESGKNGFLGFSKEDVLNSLSIESNVIKTDERLRTELYKTIDRRILNNYKDKNIKQQIVCSKYWCQDGNGVLASNGRKINKFEALDRESVIVMQIKKLKQELKQIRKQKQANSEEAKLEKSHFVQTKKELILPQFVPPKSPHHLLEEDLYHDPWALLVATIFLNKTACSTARPYVFWFLEDNPDPLTVVSKGVKDLKIYFEPLGLQSTRALQVWNMSHDFLYKQWTKVSDLYGIGKYGEDAFRMFCMGDFSVEPEDRFLRIYKDWIEMEEKRLRMREMNS
ncbi:unnamed protein product [Ceutorhynchus assimilis]|uniref:Uncharacterized protein n=1 Tax=Ceutorhynchus assimilis TaxID=467358 RepID=A0A9N9MQY3_9CUCU|nr:unnamed protein product [Ceutorhynchus assimilis]